MTRGPVFSFALVACFVTGARAEEGKGMDGVWIPDTAVMAGRPFPEAVRKTIRLEVKGDQYKVTIGKAVDRGTTKLDPAAKPKALDIVGSDGPNKGKTILAIYERDGDKLKVCYELGGKGRPKEFKSTEKSMLFLVEYRLVKE